MEYKLYDSYYQGFTSNDVFSEPALVHLSFASVIPLQSCWAAAMESGEVYTAQREKQLLPPENPASLASLATAQEGFVLHQCLTGVFNVPREPALLL